MSTTFLLSKIWKKQKKLNMLIIFERSLKIKGRVSWTVVQFIQYRLQKIRKPEVAPLEVKVDLFSSIGLGGAQQLLSISQWELFFIHGVSI